MIKHGGRYQLYKWLLLVAALMSLISCGKLKNSAPAITSASSTIFSVGTAGTFTVTATGHPTPVLKMTGTLPTGVTFDATTGILSGTPAAGSNTSYPLTFTASNGVPPDATQSFTLTVNTASTAVLIVQDGTTGTEASVLASLSGIVVGAGFSVKGNIGVPSGDLSIYRQIWDIRFNNIITGTTDIASYQSYVSGGGTLIMIGGAANGNNSIVSMVSNLGGGTITPNIANLAQSVQSPFTSPKTITSSVLFSSGIGVVSPPGTGAFITIDTNGFGTAIFFDKGKLTGAANGRLMAVFDNLFITSADANLQNLATNMVSLQ